MQLNEPTEYVRCLYIYCKLFWLPDAVTSLTHLYPETFCNVWRLKPKFLRAIKKRAHRNMPFDFQLTESGNGDSPTKIRLNVGFWHQKLCSKSVRLDLHIGRMKRVQNYMAKLMGKAESLTTTRTIPIQKYDGLTAWKPQSEAVRVNFFKVRVNHNDTARLN